MKITVNDCLSLEAFSPSILAKEVKETSETGSALSL